MDKYLRIAVKGAIFTLAGALLSKLFTYLYRLVIARFLGVEDYGTISLAIAILSFLLVFAIAGMGEGITRFYPYYIGKKQKNNALNVYYTAQKFVLVSSLIFAIVLFFISDFLALQIFKVVELSSILKYFAILIPFLALSENMWALYRAAKKPQLFFISSDLFDKGMRFLLAAALLFAGFGLFGVIFSYVAAGIATFFISKYLANKYILEKVKPKNLHSLILKYSLPLMFSGILGTLLTWVDTILLGIYRTSTEVGLYNAAIPTSQLITLPIVALGSLAIPIFTELFAKNDKDEMKKFFNSIRRWIYVASLPIFMLMIVFGEKILALLFGSEFSSAHFALIILSIGFAIGLVGQMATWVINSYGKSRVILYASIIAVIVNIALNLLLIPEYGIEGAALATVISTMSISIINSVVVKKISGLSLINSEILKPFLAALSSSALIILIDRAIFTVTPVYVVVLYGIFFLLTYLVTLYLVKGLKKEDWDLLKLILEKLGERKS